MNAAVRAVSLLAGLAMVAVAPAVHAAADLVDAWLAAQQHDAVYQAARAQLEAGQTRQRQARALGLPEVSVNGSAGYMTNDRNTTGAQFSAPGFGASNDATFRTSIDGGQTTAWGLTLQQPLYNAQRQASAQQLERQSQLAQAEFRAAQQDLILRAAQAYFGLVLAEETLATLTAQKAAAGHALDVAREKFDAGATPVTDREEAQARFDDVVNQVILADNEVQTRRALYGDLTGSPAPRLKRIVRSAQFERYAAGPLAAWTERAAQHNPLLAMQELGQEIARDEVQKFRALVSPTLDLVARIADDRMQGASGFGTTHITSSTRTVGVQLTIPLYNGGMRSAKRDEASALAVKAQFDTRALREQVLRQAQAAWLAVSTGGVRVHAGEQALKSAQSRLDATETGVEVGARTMLDFMNAQNDFYQMQRNLLQTKYQLLLDRLRLSAVAGELGEAELREIDGTLAAP